MSRPPARPRYQPVARLNCRYSVCRGLIAGICASYASGMYICKCGGEVVTPGLRTMRTMAYTSMGFNVAQVLFFSILTLAYIAELEGGVIFMLCVVAW